MHVPTSRGTVNAEIACTRGRTDVDTVTRTPVGVRNVVNTVLEELNFSLLCRRGAHRHPHHRER